MANRYWVGGTDAWNTTAGTKWAETSGGVGGAAVPTSVDDVFFDGLSGVGTVTITSAIAKSFNCTGFAGTLAGSGTLSVYGDITLGAGMTVSYTGTTIILATSTIVTNGKTLGGLSIGAVAVVSLGGALTLSGNLFVNNGTFNSNNFNITAAQLGMNPSGSSTINLGSSTVTITGANGLNIGNTAGGTINFNAGTSTIILTAANTTSLRSGIVFYNIEIRANTNITNGFTANTLTIVPSGNNVISCTLASGTTTTVTTANCSGSGPGSRCALLCDSFTSQATLSVTSLSANYCDFQSINLTGPASPATPTLAGNRGNNSNINFSAPKTVYRVGTNTTFVGSSSWALTSGGAGDNNNFPLAQDTFIIDNATAATSITLSPYAVTSMDCSARTNSFTLNGAGGGVPMVFIGNIVLGSGLAVAGAHTTIFRSSGSVSLTTAGKTLTWSITYNGGPSSTFNLVGALTTSGTLQLEGFGTFNTNNNNMTLGYLSSNAQNGPRTLSLGSSLVTITTAQPISVDVSSVTTTVVPGTSTMLLSSTSAVSRGITIPKLNILTIGGATGSGTTNINCLSINRLESTKTVAYIVQVVSDMVIGTFAISGTAGNVMTFRSSLTLTRRTITLGNVTSSSLNYLSIRDISELCRYKFAVGPNSTDAGNNNNVYFASTPPQPSEMNFMFY